MLFVYIYVSVHFFFVVPHGAQLLSRVQLFAAPWTVAHHAPLSMGFPRQEYWNGLPFPPSGDLSNPGMEPASPTSPALAGRFFTTETPGKPPLFCLNTMCLSSQCQWPFGLFPVGDYFRKLHREHSCMCLGSITKVGFLQPVVLSPLAWLQTAGAGCSYDVIWSVHTPLSWLRSLSGRRLSPVSPSLLSEPPVSRWVLRT